VWLDSWISILKRPTRALNQFPSGTSRSVTTDVPDFDHHTRDTTVLRVLYSPSSVAVPIQMNPLPSLFLKIRLKTGNGVLCDRYADITMASSTFRELSKRSTALCAYLLCLMSPKPNNKCGIYGFITPLSKERRLLRRISRNSINPQIFLWTYPILMDTVENTGQISLAPSRKVDFYWSIFTQH